MTVPSSSGWSRRQVLAAGGALAVSAGSLSWATASAAPVTGDPVAAAQLAAEAMIFGLPLVVMEATKVAMRPRPADFHHVRELADATQRSVVAPNVDTLYSIAWVDLARSPVRLSIPDTGDTFYMMEFLNCWTDVYGTVGTRLDGPGPHTVVLARSGRPVEARPGERVLYSTTDWTWILGRTGVDGPESLPAAHRIQDGYRLTPLDPDAQPPRRPPLPLAIPVDVEPASWVKSLDAHTFLSLLGPLLATSPPYPADAALIDRLSALGIVPGQQLPSLPQPIATAVDVGFHQGRLQLTTALTQAGTLRNGWLIPNRLGDYGTNYLLRALISQRGLGANPPEDALYLAARFDATNLPLTGSRDYRIRFPAAHLPPAEAFWSITLYDPNDYLVPNPINRFALGSRDHLPTDPDGNTDIIISAKPPADQRNWLPAPSGQFSLMLRAYTPAPALLTGEWTPPPVTPLSP